jgi:hypothetical protein
MQEIIEIVECYIKGEESNAKKMSKNARERNPKTGGSKSVARL